MYTEDLLTLQDLRQRCWVSAAQFTDHRTQLMPRDIACQTRCLVMLPFKPTFSLCSANHHNRQILTVRENCARVHRMMRASLLLLGSSTVDQEIAKGSSLLEGESANYAPEHFCLNIFGTRAFLPCDGDIGIEVSVTATVSQHNKIMVDVHNED